VVQSDSDQLGHVVVGKAIVEHHPIAPIGDKLQIPKQTELMTNRRFAQAQHGGQITHAHLPLSQSPKDFQPGLIGQGLEYLGQGRYFVRGERGSNSLFHHLPVDETTVAKVTALYWQDVPPSLSEYLLIY